MPEKVVIFDTTLRDGEQTPGASLNVDEKIQIARQLELLNVDVIEAGVPFSSKGDFEAGKAVAAVQHAAKYCSNVEFSAMDAGRSDLDYVVKVFTAVIDAGATTVNFP